MSKANDANGHRWRIARERVRARGDGCWICRVFGRPDAIDYSLSATHPMSFEADHLVPVSKGGAMFDPENLAAAHRACNNWRKNRSVAEVLALARAARSSPSVAPTSEW